jgi:hypothetical protein
MLGIGMLLLSGSTALMGEYREGRDGMMYCDEVSDNSTMAVQCAWTTWFARAKASCMEALSSRVPQKKV